MSVTLRHPAMTPEEFLDWAEAREGRHEFDGFTPLAMTGGSQNHSLITLNIHMALRARLKGGPCNSLGPDMALTTPINSVRFPDALVTCTKFPGTDRIVAAPVIVLEVVSPSSVRLDRIIKLREYQAVETIRRYIIVEQDSIGLTVYFREAVESPTSMAWNAMALTEEDVLQLPEIGIELPVTELYDRVEFDIPA